MEYVLHWMLIIAISGAWILSATYNYLQYKNTAPSNIRKRIIHLSSIALWSCFFIRMAFPFPFLNTRALPLMQERVDFVATVQVAVILVITAAALVISLFIKPKR
jgi:hypothetical protein